MLKIQEDLKAGVTKQAIIKVANHLITKAEQDPLIAQTLNKPNKSLEEMWKYIKSEARKKAINGCACIEDEEVYRWAQHYYDEDSIVMDKPKKETKEEKKVEDIILPDNDMDDFDF